MKDDYVEMSATCFIEFFGKEGFSSENSYQQEYDEKFESYVRDKFGLIDRVKSSQKFMFGNLLETWAEKDKQNNVYSLSQTFLDFYSNGVNVLPYPICWLEWWVPGPNSRLHTICLVTDYDNVIHFEVFLYEQRRVKKKVAGSWRFSGWFHRYEPNGSIQAGCFMGRPHRGEPTTEDRAVSQIAIASLAMLLARETKLVEKYPAAGLNAHRIKKGKVPLFSHHVVTIDPKRIVYEHGDGTDANGIKRASPRLHWRRGHVRTLSSGKKVGVPPCIIGAKAGGAGPVIDKTYRVSPT